MSLFHPRVLEKHLEHSPALSAAHQQLLESWAQNVSAGLYDSETKNDGQFIQHILVELLGYRQSGTSPTAWTVTKNQPIGSGNVDVAIGRFAPDKTAILAPFELKGAKTRDLDTVMPGRGKTPVQQAWEYAMDAKGAKWVLVSNFREIRLYAIGYGRKDYEKFDLTRPFDGGTYQRLMLLLSADNLLNGPTAALLTESDRAEKEVTQSLYREYRDLRLELLTVITRDNPATAALDAINFAQTILDRILFIAFAEDRGLLPKETLRNTCDASNPYAPQPKWLNFLGLFDAIDKGSPPLKIPGYNGGLFASNAILNDLTISDETCSRFRAIGAYDFNSEVSVNILGHIFEQSISDIEDIKAAAADESNAPGKRKRDGIYYTPPYVTRYIVEEAVGGWLEERKDEIGFPSLPPLTDEDYDTIVVSKTGRNAGKVRYNKKVAQHIEAWEEYQNVLSRIRVLDPACGSGAFLNEVFDFLYREGQAINSELTTLRGGQLHLFRWDTHILSNNLFGVDVNPESVELTKLSLWLKTANRAEKLTYLDDNIKWGNSLISDAGVAGEAAFDWGRSFPGIAPDGRFDVVVGNPPYVLSRDNTLDTLRDYASNNYSLYSDKINLYLLFIEKALSLTRLGGYLSMIVPNSFLGVQSARRCRRYLAEETELKSVINLLGSTFNGVSVEAAIFCTKKTEPTNGLVRVGNVSVPHDLELPFIRVPQGGWLQSDNAIFDLKSDDSDRKLLDKLSALPKLNDVFIPKAGLQAYEKGKGTPNQTAEDVKSHPFDFNYKHDQHTYPYLNGGDVGRYRLNWSGQWLRWGPWLSQPRQMSLFSGPRVLIREITGPYPQVLMSTYVEDTYLNNKSIVNVLPRNSDANLIYLVGVLNSKLISFYHSRRAVKGNRTIFPKAVVADVREYPMVIPSDLEQESVAGDVKLRMQRQKALDATVDSFVQLLVSEFSLLEVTNKLRYWFEMSFSELMKEAAKAGAAPLPLSKKAEWLAYHEKMVICHGEISKEIEQLEDQINDKVNRIYGLSPEEMMIINGGLVQNED